MIAALALHCIPPSEPQPTRRMEAAIEEMNGGNHNNKKKTKEKQTNKQTEQERPATETHSDGRKST